VTTQLQLIIIIIIINYRIKQEYNHFKIMNPFTALNNLSPFHFNSLHFFFTYPINPSLHFTLLYISKLTSLNFTSLHFLSPSLPLTGFQFPDPRFENMRFTAGSPYRPLRQPVPVSNGPTHKCKCIQLIYYSYKILFIHSTLIFHCYENVKIT